MGLVVNSGGTAQSGSGQTSLYDLQEMRILKCSLNTLLIVQLLIDSMFTLVCTSFDPDIDAVSRR